MRIPEAARIDNENFVVACRLALKAQFYGEG
jgi:hypothetical protein